MTQGYSIRAAIAGMVAAAGLASSSHAQSIRAVIYSQPTNQPPVQVQTLNFPPNQPISVDISPWDVSGNTTLVHVFDSDAIGAFPTLSCGRLTVVRNGVSQLNVLVGNGVDATMPNSGQVPVDAGVVDFGGFTVVDPNGVEFFDFNAVVAVTAQRDVTGSITASEVRRVEAARDITGDIIGYGGGNFGSIDTVLAGNLISGSITTELGPSTSLSRSSINRLVVGPSATAQGITGNIRSAHDIGFIFSSGPIGPAVPGGPLPVIEAANSIAQIRCVDETGPQPTFRPIAATVKAGTRYDNPADPAPQNALFQALSRPTQSGIPGSIRQIEASRLDGSVDALTIGLNPSINGVSGQRGILIRGPITAPINILLNVYYCDIIASKITAPITVGWRLTGSIVAYGEPTPEDPTLGRIERVTVGRLATPPANWAFNSLDGFGSSEAGLVLTDTGASDGQGTPGIRSRQDVWFSPLFTCGGGPVPGQQSIDSTIFAHSAGTIDLSKMTSQLTGTGGIDPAIKSLKPRIEVQTLDELRIDAMESGVVWSGLLEHETDSQTGLRVLRNDPANDYAAIGSAEFGCVSPTADVYMRQCPLAIVRADLLGEIHLAALATNETIRIGGKLGSYEDGAGDRTCTSSNAANPYVFTRCQEESPRGRDVRPGYEPTATNLFTDVADREPGAPFRASIRIADPLGLKGQIVVNSNNAFGLPLGDDGWRGQVRLKSDRVSPEDDDVIVAVDQNGTPFDAPLYTARAVLLGGAAGNGGGAIGQVPFSQKTQDSIPTAVTDINGNPQRYMPARSFNNVTSGVPVRVSYYGPLTNVSSSSVALEKFNDQTSTWSAVTSGFSVSLDPTAAMMNRDILVRGSVDGAGDPVIQPGTYRVRVKGRDASGFNVDANPVLCDVGQPFGTNPPVMASTFEFALTPRCLLGSGDPYPADIADDQGNPLWPNGIGGTANNVNTSVNEGDYNLFFGANGFFFQSGLGTAAIGMFCDIANDAGEYPGSLNYNPATSNTGVNEGDYNAFFNTFFAGCSV